MEERGGGLQTRRWFPPSTGPRRRAATHTQADDAAAVPETVRGGMTQFVEALTTPETELEQQVGAPGCMAARHCGWARLPASRHGKRQLPAGHALDAFAPPL